MSRRDRRERPGQGRRESPDKTRSEAPGSAPFPSGLLAQVLVLVAVFALVTLVAELAGAANLGVAVGVGQVGFAIALVFLLLRR